MDVIMNFLVHWGGAILCLVIGCIFLITAVKDGVKAEEKQGEETTERYMLRYPFSKTLTALLILVIGAAAGVIIGLLPVAADPKYMPLFLVLELVIGLLFGIFGGLRLRKAMVHRVLVDGYQISVYPARGKAFVTSFREIRSVKKNSDTADDSSTLVLRTNDREKIEVDNQMTNFRQFAAQVSANVELPNLSKKWRKKAAE